VKNLSLLSSLVVTLAATAISCGDSGSTVTRQSGAGTGGTASEGGSGGSTAGTGTSGGSAGSAGTVGSSGNAGTGTAGTGGEAAGAGAGGTSGGAAGTAGTGGSGGSPAVGCTGTELFCEDFEDTPDGEVMGAPWLPKGESCQYASSFTSGVTSEKAFSGSKSFKATNHSYPECRMSAPFPDADDFWVRAYIFWEQGIDMTNKEILALDLHGPSGIKKDDPAIRFGTRTKDPCTASAGPQITLIGLAGGEQTGCNGTVEEKQGEWICFEAHVTQTSNVSVKTYINGTAFTYESSGKAPTETIETPSAPAEKINHVRIGFFTHNSSGMGNVYVDDLAISTTRLGCAL
jgi:hypothetical protein